MQSIKEHNLKANHNARGLWHYRKGSVCNLSKNTIWKQITTCWTKFSHYFICMQSIKEHNLKANHNLGTRTQCHTVLYAIYQRTQSESKSQLSNDNLLFNLICMQSIKEHNLKANHNKFFPRPHEMESVCNLSKNTIWKQITTILQPLALPIFLYAIYQRTQSESKSQPQAQGKNAIVICMQSIKEHNLKANHNIFP